MVHPYDDAEQQHQHPSNRLQTLSYLGNNTPRTSSSPLQYLDHVLSRFGHHLSAQQRSDLSQSMVPSLQSSSPAGMSPLSSSTSSHITSASDASTAGLDMRKGTSNRTVAETSTITTTPAAGEQHQQQALPFTKKPLQVPAATDKEEEDEGGGDQPMDIDQDHRHPILPQNSTE